MQVERLPSYCESLGCCPLAEGGDPAPHAYGPLCFGAAQTLQVWTETQERIFIFLGFEIEWEFRVISYWCQIFLSLTSILFHNSNNTFFIGKWGAWPLQNLVTILKSMTEMGSLLKRGDPRLKKGSGDSLFSNFLLVLWHGTAFDSDETYPVLLWRFPGWFSIQACRLGHPFVSSPPSGTWC